MITSDTPNASLLQAMYGFTQVGGREGEREGGRERDPSAQRQQDLAADRGLRDVPPARRAFSLRGRSRDGQEPGGTLEGWEGRLAGVAPASATSWHCHLLPAPASTVVSLLAWSPPVRRQMCLASRGLATGRHVTGGHGKNVSHTFFSRDLSHFSRDFTYLHWNIPTCSSIRIFIF